MTPFDPYHIWLGIPPEDQPPSHYRLLGIPELEPNPDVIDAAAERQTVFLRTFQTGDQVHLAEQLLNEVSAARVCLLNAEQKSKYDRQLQVEMQPAPISPPPVTDSPAVVVKADPPAISVEQPVPSGRQPRRQKQKISPFWQKPRMLAVVGGLVAMILLVAVLNFGKDKPNPIRNPKEPATAKRGKNSIIPDNNKEQEEQQAAAAKATDRAVREKAAAPPDKSTAATPRIINQAAITIPSRNLTSVSWSPDGKRVAGGSLDRVTTVWDVATGESLLTLKGHGEFVLAVSWSPDGKWLATGGRDKTARVWDAVTGKEHLIYQGHTQMEVASIAWNPNGSRLATGSGDDTAQVWDPLSGDRFYSIPVSRGHVYALAWSPDGKRLAIGSSNNTVLLCDTNMGKELLTMRGHTGHIRGVAWSPDSLQLVSASHDKTVRLWDTVSGKQLKLLTGHTDIVSSVAYSPDGTKIASCGLDQKLRVWDAASGAALFAISAHERQVSDVAWSPDGQRLATVGGIHNSGELKIWDAPLLEAAAAVREMRVADKPDLIINSIGMKLALIPAGEFQMGSPDSEPDRNDNETQHLVNITKPFYLGVYEVTQQQYEKVMGSRPWQGKQYVKEGVDYPAVYVSHDDAVEFCRRLSKQEGVEYRLPTEAEWEYACRAGTTTDYSFGDGAAKLGQYAWYDKNAWDIGEKYPRRGGQKLLNRWGLYDMHGNVWEWCQDWYGPYGSEKVVSDPMGPAQGEHRVLRGGSFVNPTSLVRSANRNLNLPDSRYSVLGFRAARTYHLSP